MILKVRQGVRIGGGNRQIFIGGAMANSKKLTFLMIGKIGCVMTGLLGVTDMAHKFDLLLPTCPYTQALELSMHVLTDHKNFANPLINTDLCVGRLVRLRDYIQQVESVARTRPLILDDILYMRELFFAICSERKQDIDASHHAQDAITAIKSTFDRLLQAP